MSNDSLPKWMIYGATGYTGELMAREAVRRGLRPVIAGRDAVKVQRLAKELGLESRVFGVSPAVPAGSLEGMALVLHCAGPFSATSAAMVEACLQARAHYLDITGEIDVFEAAHARDAEARAAGIVVCPGVGFDVVPSDCLAASLAAALPGATHLALGFMGGGGFSLGTAKTMAEGFGYGGRVRTNGVITPVPLAYRSRRVDFGDGAGALHAVTIPWGDVSTAYFSTGIPNIEVYRPMSPGREKALARMNWVRPLLRLKFVQNFMKRKIDAQPPGPTDEQRATTRSFLWGEVRDATGRTVTGHLAVANGYTVTVIAGLGIAERLLREPAPAGAITPSRLMGAGYASSLPGSEPVRLTGAVQS